MEDLDHPTTGPTHQPARHRYTLNRAEPINCAAAIPGLGAGADVAQQARIIDRATDAATTARNIDNAKDTYRATTTASGGTVRLFVYPA